MNWLDIIILVILAIETFLGFRSGIIKVVLSLAGVIVGVFLAGRLYIPLSERLSFIPQAGIAEAIAFTLILVGTMLVASLLAVLLKEAASALLLGWVNHLGGAVFGLVLGALTSAALLAIIIKFFGVADIISRSKLAVILLDRFPAVLALLPAEFDVIRSFFQ